MEELRNKLEALAQKISLKEAEILDLRNEVESLRALLNAAIDEQIRLEEEAEHREEQAKIDRAAALVQDSLNQQKQKEAQESEEESQKREAQQKEEERKAAELAREEAEHAEAERSEAEKKELEAKAAALKAEETKEEEVAEPSVQEEEEQPEHHHEAIMRTIEKMSRSIAGSDKQTNAEQYSDKPTLSDKVSKLRLNDLKKAIGLNEKFLYANELFGGDMGAFKQAVDELNHLDSESDAIRLLNEDLADKYHWKEEDETVIAFKSLVSRRFA